MPGLDEFDLDKEPESPGAAPDGGTGLRNAAIAAALLLLAGVVAVVFVARGCPRGAKPTPAPSAEAPAATPGPSPTPMVSLPPLDQSDAFVRDLLKALSSSPPLAAWLANTALIRTFAAVVENVANGETPVPHLRFLAPKQGFLATPKRGRQVIDPKGYEGYGPFADTIASLDVAGCVRVYRLLEPLFDTAYRDLGHPEGGFSKTLDRAMGALLETPAPQGEVTVIPVVRAVVVYEYADLNLESLTPAQKQFLRIGPANVRKVQAKLRELREVLKKAP